MGLDCQIKIARPVLRKKPHQGQLNRLIEYMYVANVDERWSDCERLFLNLQNKIVIGCTTTV
jgi:hypothetical protein